MGLITAGKLLLKGKKALGVIKEVKGGVSAITGVASGTKFKGQKTVSEIKSAITHKKYNEAIREAGSEITKKLKKTAEDFKKLTGTLKK